MKSKTQFQVMFFMIMIIGASIYWGMKIYSKLEEQSLISQENNVPENKIESIAQRAPASVASSIDKTRPLEKIKNDILKNSKSKASAVLSYGNGQYFLYKDYKIIPKQDRDQYQIKKILADKFQYLIIETDDRVENSMHVVFNDETNDWAIVTGVIKLKYENVSIKEKLINEFDLEIISEFDHLNLVHLKPRSEVNIFKLEGILRLQTGVVRSQLEILENPYFSK